MNPKPYISCLLFFTFLTGLAKRVVLGDVRNLQGEKLDKAHVTISKDSTGAILAYTIPGGIRDFSNFNSGLNTAFLEVSYIVHPARAKQIENVDQQLEEVVTKSPVKSIFFVDSTSFESYNSSP